MKKIVVSDYDGTFYRNNKDLSNNILAVQDFTEKENIFILATGRSYLSMMAEINKYHIKYHYLILCHGALY